MRKWLIVLLCLLLIAVIAVWITSVRLQPTVKARVERILSDRFDSAVTIGSIHVKLFPRAGMVAENITIRHHYRSDVPPIISIRKISANPDMASLLGANHDIQLVRLEGLQIHIAAGTFKKKAPDEQKEQKNFTPAQAKDNTNHLPFVIREIIADGTLLEILPKKAGKEPLDFDIKKLTLRSVGVDRPMNFVAELTNAKPPGLIETQGRFGPWDKEDPGSTPLSGHYTFDKADLNVFKGISGLLSSEGDYSGELDTIDAKGTTDTPDFSVDTSGKPVDLKTEFSATIDGTNGDTYLHPVIAHFRDSNFVCNGSVAGTPGVKGKTVYLDVVADKARMEDLLYLAVKAKKPLLTGQMKFKSKLMIPPGDVEVIQKIILDGQFSLAAAHFTSDKVQGKIDTFSTRAQGLKSNSDEAEEDVASHLSGKFILKNSLLRLNNFAFVIPGAQVSVNGTYGLRSEAVDMRGEVRLQATLSHMATGWKSLLLKPVDPFFKKDGAGALLHITITGSRDDIHYGLDLHRKDTKNKKKK